MKNLLQPCGLHQTVDCSDLTEKQRQSLAWQHCNNETEQVRWLILHFNTWFSHQNTILQHSSAEPEYFPSTAEQPARIAFAHGFLNSALHEISHWCIAGAKRRTLPDLGYWYAPDGRDASQQALFEQVEVKPQAIEWMFAQAMGRPFRVSLDNLNGDAGDGNCFKDAVFAQVQAYLSGQTALPRDAACFIQHLCAHTRAGSALRCDEFLREDLA